MDAAITNVLSPDILPVEDLRNSVGSKPGTHSQAVNNSSQVDSTTSQQGMNAGNAGIQAQAGSGLSQEVSSPQASSINTEQGRNTGNASNQSQAGSASPRHPMLVLLGQAPLGLPSILHPKRREYTGRP